MNNFWVTRDEARILIRKFCAYQERSHLEVENRLKKIAIPEDWIPEFIVELIEENYLNETRFAELFVRSKVNQKKWGRIKIIKELKLKGVSQNIIKIALNEIDEEIYTQNLRDWIERKNDQWSDEKEYVRRNKVIKFCMSKGYEYGEIVGGFGYAQPDQ